MSDTVNTELIRGHVDTIILRTLVAGDSYPYDILKQISEKTQGRYQLKQATLYSCMKRLEKSGLITSYWGDQSDGGRRKYYSLTDLGREMLERDQAEWEYSRTIINNLLSDKNFDLANDEAPFDASSLRPLTRRTRAVDEDYTKEEKAEDGADSPKVDGEVLVTTPYMMHKDASREENNPPASLFDYAQKCEEEDIDKEIVAEQAAQQESTSINNATIISQEAQPSALSIEEAQQMAAASKLLQIGSFAPTMVWDPERESAIPTITNDESVYTTVDIPAPISDTYIKKLDNLYASEQDDVSLSSVEPAAITTPTTELSLIQFNDLKNSMLQNGYRLRLYNRPDEFSRRYLKYVYANKLLRDSYLALCIPLLLVYIITLCLRVYSSVAVNVLLGVAIALVAIVPTVIYMHNPEKRTREEYQFSHDLVIRSIIALLAMIITFVVLIFGCKVDISKNAEKYIIAWVFALAIPLYSLIYQLLLKRKVYYIDK